LICLGQDETKTSATKTKQALGLAQIVLGLLRTLRYCYRNSVLRGESWVDPSLALGKTDGEGFFTFKGLPSRVG
jgi:hypothetical protein